MGRKTSPEFEHKVFGNAGHSIPLSPAYLSKKHKAVRTALFV